MKIPDRITIALDEETSDLIAKLRKEKKSSQSELIRQALRFYWENRGLVDASLKNKTKFYTDLLLSGEHVILDVDHWLLFLELVESSPKNEYFWEKHREVAKSHAAQLSSKVLSVEELLARLEACNFFKVAKNSESDFTLILGSETTKKFIKMFIEEYFLAAGLKVEVKEDLAKLRVIDKT
jgi:Arc/MetJ-type ribon-helix-helix transcriptional regulator